jgi:hypothetical protein
VGRTLVQEIETVVRDVTLRTVRSIRFPISGAGGEPIEIGVVAEDVTDHSNSEEAFKRLRRSETTQDISVIALSATASKVDIRKGLDAGFKVYLT